MRDRINWIKVIIKVFAWVFLLISIVAIYLGIYYNYLNQEWLIGPNYIPVDFSNPEMITIYKIVLLNSLLSISSLLVIMNYKFGYKILFFTLTLVFINFFMEEFTMYHYRYIINHRLYSILFHVLLFGIPLILLFREIKNERFYSKVKTC